MKLNHQNQLFSQSHGCKKSLHIPCYTDWRLSFYTPILLEVNISLRIWIFSLYQNIFWIIYCVLKYRYIKQNKFGSYFQLYRSERNMVNSLKKRCLLVKRLVFLLPTKVPRIQPSGMSHATMAISARIHNIKFGTLGYSFRQCSAKCFPAEQDIYSSNTCIR